MEEFLEYLEVFYKRKRLRSTPYHKSPVQLDNPDKINI